MPKFRKAKKRHFFGKAKHFYRRHKSGLGTMGMIVGGGVYGYGRQYLADLVKPLTDKLPLGLGDATDNIVLGSIAVAAKRYSKNRYVQTLANAIIVVESAMIGSEIRAGKIGASSTTTSNGNMEVIG